MNRTLKTLLLLIYLLGVTTVCLYVLFPSDTAKAFIESAVSRSNPDVQLPIKQVRLSFPPGIQIDSGALVFQDQKIINIENIRFLPHILTLLNAWKTIGVTANAGGGKLKGKLEAESSNSIPQIRANGKISGGRLEDLPVLEILVSNKISGACEGTFEYNGINGAPKTLSAQLSITDCSVEINPPVDGLTTLSFKQVNAKIRLDKQGLKIEECILRGAQMDGQFAGSIGFRRPLEKSIVNITGEMRLHLKFLATLRQGTFGGVVLDGDAGAGDLPFKYEGTLKDPLFQLTESVSR